MTPCLLGGHVFGRAADHALARQTGAGLRLVLHQLGDAEVEHLGQLAMRSKLLDEDVLGLEVAVQDAEAVRFGERGEDLQRDVDDALPRERVVARDDVLERVALDELHHDVRDAVRGLSVVDDRNAVRMVEARRVVGLAREPSVAGLIVEEVRREDLGGERLAERQLLGFVHPTHRPFADQVFDDVLVREDEPLVGVAGLRLHVADVMAAVGAEERVDDRATAALRADLVR